jgi:hypothetical protein
VYVNVEPASESLASESLSYIANTSSHSIHCCPPFCTVQRAPVECARMFHHRTSNYMRWLGRSGIVGSIQDYVIRYEAQSRG